MEQMARNVTMEDAGFLINRRYLLHDRDIERPGPWRTGLRWVISPGMRPEAAV
jgi:hypothetical protein